MMTNFRNLAKPTQVRVTAESRTTKLHLTGSQETPPYICYAKVIRTWRDNQPGMLLPCEMDVLA
eukprot:4195861-Amphidinium_carterae.1